MDIFSTVVKTKPFDDQNPGTSGLRKPTKVFISPNYSENFIQSIFNYLGKDLEKHTLIVGGDGRYYCKESAEMIVRMAAANKVGKIIVGKDGILSTPAASNLIRKRKALGGILLTASHNPGGIDHDFGIKFNSSNGGAANNTVTNAIFSISKLINEYKIITDYTFDISKLSSTSYKVDGEHTFVVEVIDPVQDYLKLMKTVFDFPAIKTLISGSASRPPFRVVIDSMSGVTGPYAVAIFENELGAERGSVLNSVPLPDFGGGHPDPNLHYGKPLINTLISGGYDFGSAFDGDGDRNMIVGAKGFFVAPSDSLAVLATHINCIPYFLQHGVKGVARSMPTSRAVDRVASSRNMTLYEVPTGWKYFCNLMDAGLVSLCGEESFGTGSCHIREKDGIWAALAWLSVVAHTSLPVENIVTSYWTKFGRDFYVRHDWEGLSAKMGDELMSGIIPRIESAIPKFAWKLDSTGIELIGRANSIDVGVTEHKSDSPVIVTITRTENFSYTDPIDKSIIRNQGIIVSLSNDARIIFRLSGTGSTGATVRIYMERYMPGGQFLFNKDLVISPMIQMYLDISNIKQISGMDAPSVIT